ncbi:condensation domain-containing protein [Streptomyces sp. NPDC019531]|uniref:condensation domain-containing protein n=1 Tax=Streptomyces sp. NPDC019531 TaxID=3365062 RepID=UPI00384F94D6
MTALASGTSLPLLASQRRRWTWRRPEPDDPKDNCGAFFRFTGGLDRDALKTAVDRAYAETEALRVVFEEHDGDVRQVIPLPGPAPWSSLELSGDDAAFDHMNRSLGVPFGLLGGSPLCSHTLIETPGSTWLFFCNDHIIVDAYGAHRYLLRIAQHYNAIVGGTPAPPRGFAPLARLQSPWTPIAQGGCTSHAG